jgi:hypothetical protein
MGPTDSSEADCERATRSGGATSQRRFQWRVADEVITHLGGLIVAQVRVTLEIEAEVPAGVPENVVRTVTENSRGVVLHRRAHGAHLINGEGVVIPGTVREFSTSQTELVLPLRIREPGHCADVDNCTLIYSWRVWPANGCGLGPVSEGNYYGTF